MPPPYSEQLIVSVDAPTRERLEALMNEHEVSMSAVIRRAVKVGLPAIEKDWSAGKGA